MLSLSMAPRDGAESCRSARPLLETLAGLERERRARVIVDQSLQQVLGLALAAERVERLRQLVEHDVLGESAIGALLELLLEPGPHLLQLPGFSIEREQVELDRDRQHRPG